MASTYVNNLRLEEMATGEQSGTWGTKTNTNLELIGQAVAWGTRAIANASTDNITIADGAADADRCLGLKLTGGGQACTVTLLPNTSSKTWVMYNATSYTLTFTCGSGANVAILAGETKMIATDGLGSGGVVHDLLTAVNLAGTTKTAALTNAGALSNQGTVTVGVNDTGYDVQFFGATSGAHMLWDESADDLKLVGAAGLTVAGDIDVDGTTNLDAVDIDGAVQIDATLSVGVDGTGYDVTFFGDNAGRYVKWDESADSLLFSDNAKAVFGQPGNDLQIYHDSSNSYIADTGDGDLVINTNGNAISLNPNSGGEYGLRVLNNGAVNLYYDNALKLATVTGGVNVTGEMEADSLDIDGASQLDGTLTVGVNDTGYDVKFFGAASGAYLLYDESDDDLILKGGAPKLVIQDGLTDSFTSGAVSSSLSFQARNSDVRVLGQIDAVHASTNGTVGAMRFQTRHGDTLAERLRIDSSGAVGIGRADPQSIVGSTPGGLVLQDGGRAATTTQFFVGNSSGTAIMTLRQDATAYMEGPLTIGAGNSSSAVLSGGFLFHTTGINEGFLQHGRPSGAAQSMTGFYNGGSVVGEIRTSTTATQYFTSSDYRLKEEVVSMTNALAKVAQLKPRTYKWKSNGEASQGFIAHELQEVVPEAVAGVKDELDEDGKPKYQGVDTSFLVATLTAAMQEQQALIEALTSRITALEG
jgi:hypothetical protein